MFLDVHKRKVIILICGIILTFFTGMNKILVPGPIYSQLQTELLFSPSMIGALGSAFMYSYALSQLLSGVFSNRYGGVRVLLIGGACFTVGVILFPMCHNPYLMYGCRLIAGFGAGTVFIGVVKMLGDLFPQHFGIMLGISMLVSYLGPTVGTVPMVWFISAVGWRVAYFVPSVISAVAMAVILLFIKGTIKKTVPGDTLAPLWQIMRNRQMWALCISIPIIFGIYYLLPTQIGQKCLEDFYKLSKYQASLCITVMTILVALNNVVIHWVVRLAGGRRKPVIVGSTLILFLATTLGCCSFLWNWPLAFMLLAFFLITIPAGFFSLYGAVSKELNPPELTGLAVAVLNFCAFVFIAVWGNISGFILNLWKDHGTVFPGTAYAALFGFLAFSGLCSFLLALRIRETGTKAQ